MPVKIESVSPNSTASKAGIKAGETLISINGNKINDALDYGFYVGDEELVVELDTRTVVIEKKDEYDDIGLNF
ncbi:MAG: PDZ domain-containing protein, partial [Ruminiclostridium sp.]|nr:PDZ domain-containing protein [Ruminiclostridium sp.]